MTIEIFDSEENIHHCENINKMEVEKEMNLIKSIIGMFDVSDFKLIKKRKKKEKEEGEEEEEEEEEKMKKKKKKKK